MQSLTAKSHQHSALNNALSQARCASTTIHYDKAVVSPCCYVSGNRILVRIWVICHFNFYV